MRKFSEISKQLKNIFSIMHHKSKKNIFPMLMLVSILGGIFYFEIISSSATSTYTDTTTGIVYTLGSPSSGKATVSGYTPVIGSDVTISETINTSYSVTNIGTQAFKNCSKLTSITIPNSVTNIGPNAFEGCSKLTSITIPNSVETIGGSVFSGCIGLTSITIPEHVTSIGSGTFNDCINLASIEVDLNNTTYKSDSGILFKNSGALICYPTGKADTSYTIPRFVPSSVTSYVTSISDYAFRGCSKLTSITIPDSVTSISKSAFSGCTSLTGITIPNSVTTIGGNVFQGCSALEGVTLPTNINFASIGTQAFQGCTSLQSVTIPNSVTSVGQQAFYGCTSLQSVTLPTNTKFNSINIRTFQSCTVLISITIPNSVTSISDYAFRDCASLQNITLPNSVTTIGPSIFSGCKNLSIIGVARDFNFNNFTNSGVIPTNNNNNYNIDNGYQNGNFHDYKWVNNGTTHTGTCTICGATVTEEHTYDFDPISKVEPLDETFGVNRYKCKNCDHIKNHYIIKENTCPMNYPNIEGDSFYKGQSVIDSILKVSSANVIAQDLFKAINGGGEFTLSVQNVDKSSANYNDYVSRLSGYPEMSGVKFFDINPIVDSNIILGELDNPVRMLFEIPEGYDYEHLKVVLIKGSDNVEFSTKLETINGKNYVAIWTNHFNTYALISTLSSCGTTDNGENADNGRTANSKEDIPETIENAVNSGDNTLALVITLFVIVMASGLIVIITKKRKNNLLSVKSRYTEDD